MVEPASSIGAHWEEGACFPLTSNGDLQRMLLPKAAHIPGIKCGNFYTLSSLA